MSTTTLQTYNRGMAPFLRVPDILRSVRYYQEILGFSLDMLDRGFALLTRDRATIMLQQWTSDDQFANGRWAAYVWVDDVDELHADCSSKDVNVTSSVTTMPWGTREFQIEDPDGYLLRFGQIGAVA